MAEKAQVTEMVLTVNLQSRECYKNVKKLLCKFPGIQDQVYDKENNKVTIKVVCSSPEETRNKLCCKGKGCIKSIEILKPKEPEKKKPQEPPPPPPCYTTNLFIRQDIYCCINCCKEGCKGPCHNPCYCGGYRGRPVCDCWCGDGGYGGYHGCRCRQSYCEVNFCKVM